MSKQETFYGTGRRKTATARVYLRRGAGQFKIVSGATSEKSRRDLNDYLKVENLRGMVLAPLIATGTQHTFDVYVNVRGGGVAGQAGAIRHGLTRALMRFNPELRSVLKPLGFVTRDARETERKKYGQPGARKRGQYSKR